MSVVLASPRAARIAQAYAEEMIESVKRVACTTLAFQGVRQDPRICPYTMRLTTKSSLGAFTRCGNVGGKAPNHLSHCFVSQ